jgi:hypothetical protein
VAPFLQAVPGVKERRINLFWGLFLALLAACGAEEPPRLTAAGPRAPESPKRTTEIARTGAMLAASGRQSYEGFAALHCVAHEEEGLQISFRTGDPAMPVVALRVADYRGGGPYRARLFVTGRSRSGALVTSTGEAQVKVAQRAAPDGGAGALLGGSFSGVYSGEAGRGSLEGRFGTCSFTVPPDRAANVAAAR